MKPKIRKDLLYCNNCKGIINITETAKMYRNEGKITLIDKIKIKVLTNWKGQNEFIDWLENEK